MTGNEIRNLVIEVSAARGTGHVGSALSVCEILAALFNLMHLSDRFVLSKGHAALAYYAALQLKGDITMDKLMSYCQDGSLFGVHPEVGVPGVYVATGSLGMGLSMAVGMALTHRDKEVFCLVSDAEMDEGSTWEAIMLASHEKLSNLTLIIDDNHSQAMGPKSLVLGNNNWMKKLEAFGWVAVSCPGHDQDSLAGWLTPRTMIHPRAIVAHTEIGYGISSMQGNFTSHYLPLTKEQVAEWRARS